MPTGNEKRSKSEDQVHEMIRKAANAEESEEAIKFSQAACNVSKALQLLTTE